MDRARKQDVVSALREIFAQTNLIVVAHHLGLTVAEASDLRRQMREAGATYRVTKNRLVRLALEGTRYGGLADLFEGPTAIAYSLDPLAAAKAVVEFAKKNEKLVILGGAMGEDVLDVGGVKALARLPSLDELRAQLVGLINTPATRIVSVLQAPASQVARVISAHASAGAAS